MRMTQTPILSEMPSLNSDHDNTDPLSSAANCIANCCRRASYGASILRGDCDSASRRGLAGHASRPAREQLCDPFRS